MIPILLNTDSREIGLLEFFEASPFLKAGITFAMFSLSGKISIRNDSSMIRESCMEMRGSTSSRTLGEMKKLLSLEEARYLRGERIRFSWDFTGNFVGNIDKIVINVVRNYGRISYYYH